MIRTSFGSSIPAGASSSPKTFFAKTICPVSVENVVSSVIVTLSLNVWLLMVFTAPPLTTVVPAASVVMLVNAATAPTALLNSVFPSVFTAKSLAPSSVSSKTISPALELSRAILAALRTTLLP